MGKNNNLEEITLTNIYYTIYSRETGEKLYNDFIAILFKENYYDLKKIYYNDDELTEKLNWEIDEVLRLENETQKCEESYEGLSEMKIMSKFVNWRKTSLKSEEYETLYTAELNNNGKKLIKRWNEYLVRTVMTKNN